VVVIEVKIEHVAIAEDKREPPVAVHPDAGRSRSSIKAAECKA
jgi:hypothetical protein